MADQLSDEEIVQFKEVFSLFDRSGRGLIPAAELGTVLRIFGKIPSQTEIEEFIKEVDGDKTGFVDFPDFLTIITRNIKDRYWNEEEIREAFRVFDKNETGYISEDEFNHIFLHLGEGMKEEELNQLISDAKNVTENGLVNYEEFVNVMTKSDIHTRNFLKSQTCPPSDINNC